jgi:hypothetical protein
VVSDGFQLCLLRRRGVSPNPLPLHFVLTSLTRLAVLLQLSQLHALRLGFASDRSDLLSNSIDDSIKHSSL